MKRKVFVMLFFFGVSNNIFSASHPEAFATTGYPNYNNYQNNRYLGNQNAQMQNQSGQSQNSSAVSNQADMGDNSDLSGADDLLAGGDSSSFDMSGMGMDTSGASSNPTSLVNMTPQQIQSLDPATLQSMISGISNQDANSLSDAQVQAIQSALSGSSQQAPQPTSLLGKAWQDVDNGVSNLVQSPWFNLATTGFFIVGERAIHVFSVVGNRIIYHGAYAKTKANLEALKQHFGPNAEINNQIKQQISDLENDVALLKRATKPLDRVLLDIKQSELNMARQFQNELKDFDDQYLKVVDAELKEHGAISDTKRMELEKNVANRIESLYERYNRSRAGVINRLAQSDEFKGLQLQEKQKVLEEFNKHNNDGGAFEVLDTAYKSFREKAQVKGQFSFGEGQAQQKINNVRDKRDELNKIIDKYKKQAQTNDATNWKQDDFAQDAIAFKA